MQRPRRPQDPAIYSLGRAGYSRLKEKGMIDPSFDPGWNKIQKRQQISELFLRHELAVMDVKAAFVSAIGKRPDLELIQMSTAADRHGFRVVEAVPDSKRRIRFKSIIARPDGFIHVRQTGEEKPALDHFFFLEVDRGTETLSRLVRKARHYSQYYRKGGFAAKLGFKRGDYKRFPFRVLIIFVSAERRNNVAEKLLGANMPIKSQAFLTTMDELKLDPLGAIWLRPVDYQALAGRVLRKLAIIQPMARRLG